MSLAGDDGIHRANGPQLFRKRFQWRIHTTMVDPAARSQPTGKLSDNGAVSGKNHNAFSASAHLVLSLIDYRKILLSSSATLGGHTRDAKGDGVSVSKEHWNAWGQYIAVAAAYAAFYQIAYELSVAHWELTVIFRLCCLVWH